MRSGWLWPLRITGKRIALPFLVTLHSSAPFTNNADLGKYEGLGSSTIKMMLQRGQPDADDCISARYNSLHAAGYMRRAPGYSVPRAIGCY